MDSDDAQVKKDSENAQVPTPKREGVQAQTFDRVGLLRADQGVLYLVGRSGERDHLYPLHQAIKRYYETRKMVMAMFRNGIRGWDTLQEICDEMKAKILETIDQRRHMNLPVNQVSEDFEARFLGKQSDRLSPDDPGYESRR